MTGSVEHVLDLFAERLGERLLRLRLLITETFFVLVRSSYRPRVVLHLGKEVLIDEVLL